MNSQGKHHPTVIHFTIDGRQGILRAVDIAVAFQLLVALANSTDYRQWPHPSPREMVRILSQDTSAGLILFRRQLPTGMLFVDHVLRSNLFPIHHVVQRRSAILEALYRISEGFWFSPPELIMTSFFHFEKKIHKKHLIRAKTIPLLFLRLLSHVLEHLGFLAEPHQERCRVCEATFTVEKWSFVPGAPPLPAYPPTKADPQIDPPQVHQPPATPAQEPHITMTVAPAFDPMLAPPMPAAHSSPPAPTTLASPSSSSPQVAFIHITAHDFLAIMTVVRNFVVTSQPFAAPQSAMAERMARTKAVLAQNTAILA